MGTPNGRPREIRIEKSAALIGYAIVAVVAQNGSDVRGQLAVVTGNGRFLTVIEIVFRVIDGKVAAVIGIRTPVFHDGVQLLPHGINIIGGLDGGMFGIVPGRGGIQIDAERFGGFSLAHAVAARIGRGDVLIQFLRTRNVSRHFRYPRIGSLVLRENEIEKAHGHISQKSRIVVRFPGVRIPIEVVRARHIGVVGVISLISVGTARRRIRRIVAAGCHTERECRA